MSFVTRTRPGSTITRLPGTNGSVVAAGNVASGVKVDMGSADDITDSGATVGSLVDGTREVASVVGVPEGCTVGISPVELVDWLVVTVGPVDVCTLVERVGVVLALILSCAYPDPSPLSSAPVDATVVATVVDHASVVTMTLVATSHMPLKACAAIVNSSEVAAAVRLWP